MNNERFVKPAAFIQEDSFYQHNEVGLNHPTNNAFIRIRDNGDIEIHADDGLGIILGVARKNITFYADEIKFLTKQSAGLRWNDLAFNASATNYSQPTFTKLPEDKMRVDLFQGVSHYLK